MTVLLMIKEYYLEMIVWVIIIAR